MLNKTVTIITPTCGRMEGLKEAVDSVLNQSYRDWEYFIVSDGNDPRVREFVESLNDGRIRYLWTLKTQYAGHLQRNFALRFASGEFVFCLDDDNIIYPDYVKKMAECFTGGETGYAICRIKYDDRGILSPREPFSLAGIDMLNYMVRTDLARQVGGWIPFDSYSADFNLINNISKISKGNSIPEVLGWHRTLSASNGVTQKNGAVTNWLLKNRETLLKLQDLVNGPLSLLNIKIYFNKSIRVNINRIIYRFLSKSWLKEHAK